MSPKKLKDALGGIGVLVITPFDSQLELDVPSLRKLIRFLLDNGLGENNAVLIPMGSAGEFPMLSVEERKKILEVIMQEAKEKIPVVPSCCDTNVRTVIELLHYAESVGAAGAMVSPPYYYNGLNEKAVIQHYKIIAEATQLGIMVYNNYFATQLDIPLSTLEELAEIDNVVALKEITPNYSKIHRVTESIGDKITVVNGTSERNEPYASFMGTKGIITSMPNYAPKFSLQMWQLVSEAKYNEAKKLHAKLMPLFQLMAFEAEALRGIGYVKEAMRMLGIISSSSVRPPFLPISEDKKQKLRGELERLGILS